MPILKNNVSKQLMQVDLAAAADEIERLHTALIEILDAVDDMRLVNRLKDIERIARAALKRETP